MELDPYSVRREVNGLGRTRWVVVGPNRFGAGWPAADEWKRVRTQRGAERVARRWQRQWSSNQWRILASPPTDG